MSAIIQDSPLATLSQETLPTGDSCVLVIFGASGDLTKRKLIPGLYNLSCVGCMNPEFEVLGIGDGQTLKRGCTTWRVTSTIRSSIRSCALDWRRWRRRVRAQTICSM